jgi:pyrroloquinoline-quinone synthase
MDVLAELDLTRAGIRVLEHPFYRRWSAGELGAGELGCYAEQYRHAVVALAAASHEAARAAPAAYRAGLREHAEEETAHVHLWDRFARAAGARAAEQPAQALPATQACVQAWTAGDDLLERLAVLYVVEAGQPEVARTKLEGLTEHYGYSQEGPAVEYFRVHERRDREHARQARELIARLLGGVDSLERTGARMCRRARAALQANWQLLDAVEKAAVPGAVSGAA